MNKNAVVMLLGLVSASCSYGPRIADFGPAHTPYGVSGRLTTRDAEISGEVLEVRDTGVIVLTVASGKLRLVPYSEVRASRFDRLGGLLGGNRAPDPAARERLRLVSRFPQGMSPAVLHTLLNAHGQTELLGVR